MGEESPGRSVPLRRKKVTPVLSDEPRAKEGCDLRTARQFPEFAERTQGENGQHDESERELVDAKPADVDARTEPVPFQTQHGMKTRFGPLALHEKAR
jgi:hypothetical protein